MNRQMITRTVTYPIGDLIWVLAGVEFIICAIAYLKPSVRLAYTISAVIWPILYYLFAQYRYTKIVIFNDRLRKKFIGSLYLKDKEILFSEINRTSFQLDVIGRYGVPYVLIYLKNNKRIRISMPKHELEQIKHELNDLGITVESTKGS